MKEITPAHKDPISIHKKKEIEKKTILQGRLLPKRGHIIWKFNTETFILGEAEFMNDVKEISFDRASKKDFKVKNRKILIEENCVYFNALNLKNALKILKRDYGIIIESIEDV